MIDFIKTIFSKNISIYDYFMATDIPRNEGYLIEFVQENNYYFYKQLE